MMSAASLTQDRFRWLNDEVAKRPEGDPIRRELELSRAAALFQFEADVAEELYWAAKAGWERQAVAVSLVFEFWRKTHPSLFGDLDAMLERTWPAVHLRLDEEHPTLDQCPRGCPLSPEDFRVEADLAGRSTPEGTLLDGRYATILQQHPLIFRAFGRPDRWNDPFSERNGVECGPGWSEIVQGLASWLEQRARELKMSGVSERDVPRVLQVKEKFGTLRFCARVPDILLNHWHREVEAAEERSAKVCECCGAPGQLLREGWWRTRCEKCEIEGWKS